MGAQKKSPRKGKQVVAWLPDELVYRMRAACFHNRLTVRQFVEKAVEKEVRMYERTKNGGRRYDEDKAAA